MAVTVKLPTILRKHANNEAKVSAEGGVFGVLPGVIGAIQATEAIKLITGEGDSLVGRLLLYDALHMDFQEVKIRWDADCPVCGKEPTITELIDYEQFCGVPARPE